MENGSRAYLDWNATTPLLPEVVEAMLRAFEVCGNPSSVHSHGRAARALMETARAEVASLVGATQQNVFFTGSGTEAANAVLTSGLGSSKTDAGCTRLLVSAVEHSCTLAGGQFEPEAVTILPVDANGIIKLDVLQKSLIKAQVTGERILLSLQLANNETGVIQPVSEAAKLVYAVGGLVHVDAVQAAGKIPVDMNALGVDVLTLSAHKFGGPKGIGAFIFINDKIRLKNVLVRGGGQERGQRAGTENVAGIVGFGTASRIALERMRQMEGVRHLRDRLETNIRSLVPEAVIFASDVPRLPNTTCFAVHGMVAETALIAFDMDGVSVSSGSACSSGKVRKSHVLTAMGVADTLAVAAMRVSLGSTTTDIDVTIFLKALDNRLKVLDRQQVKAA